MNRLTVALLLVASLVLPEAVIASGESGWYCTGDARVTLGTQQGSVDGFDTNDLLSTVNAPNWYMATYHANSVDDWGGATGFYVRDLKAPLNPGETKTWPLFIWAAPSSTVSDLHVTWGWYGGPTAAVSATLELLQKPTGVTGGPSIGSMWTSPPSNFVLPYYATPNGLTGYQFRLTLTAVPEPSSILALAGGIAGLGGLALRRHRSR